MSPAPLPARVSLVIRVNLAVALNESALYLGSALGAGAGGLLLLLNMPGWSLAIGAGAVALLGAALQFLLLRTHHFQLSGRTQNVDR